MIENPLTNSPPDVALPRGGRLRQVQQSALTVWKEQLSYRLELSLSLLCIQKILEILCRKLALWRCIVVLPEAALSQGWDEEVMLSLPSFAWYHQASVVLQDPQVGTLRTCWGSIRNQTCWHEWLTEYVHEGAAPPAPRTFSGFYEDSGKLGVNHEWSIVSGVIVTADQADS